MRFSWHNANFSALHSILRLWLCRFRARGHFFGLKATFPGTRPLLQAQGNFYGSRATFLGTKPLSLALHSDLRLWLCCFLAQGHFLSITNADYGPNAVSGHKAIFFLHCIVIRCGYLKTQIELKIMIEWSELFYLPQCNALIRLCLPPSQKRVKLFYIVFPLPMWVISPSVRGNTHIQQYIC